MRPNDAIETLFLMFLFCTKIKVQKLLNSNSFSKVQEKDTKKAKFGLKYHFSSNFCYNQAFTSLKQYELDCLQNLNCGVWKAKNLFSLKTVIYTERCYTEECFHSQKCMWGKGKQLNIGWN